MIDKLDTEFGFGREALDVRAYRQELLSSNIANADTPGYKARDVEFSGALASALRQNGLSATHGAMAASGTANVPMSLTAAQSAGASSGWSDASGAVTKVSASAGSGAGMHTGVAMTLTSSGHLAGQQPLMYASDGTNYGRPAYRIPTQPSMDGNTVDIDTERVQFADNTLHYESTMTVLSQQIKAMLSAITSNS
jgi:flagellar basal-body rod protein FlgB